MRLLAISYGIYVADASLLGLIKTPSYNSKHAVLIITTTIIMRFYIAPVSATWWRSWRFRRILFIKEI